MERLTYRDKDGFPMMKKRGGFKQGGVERLAAYEDTGLTPERCAVFAKADEEGRYIIMRNAEQKGVARLRELAESDKDGRVVVLPCKVGNTVYYRCGKRITDFEVVGFSVDREGASIIYAEHHADENGTAYSCFFDVKKIGRTVFFTREEAEQALRKEKVTE